ncbi:MAG: linked oxidase-like protein [Acidobacteria bacterium]|nr:linked oxidase-like protein [Acidobacteriota bacterium]
MPPVLLDRAGRPVPEHALAEFVQAVRGRALSPSDPGYDDARRVFNAMVDRRPGLVVQPVDSEDVQHAVRFARRHDVLVSIKGGGHSAPGHAVCDDGLLVDLSRMRAIAVDPAARVAIAEGGATWGEFDEATQRYGLAVTGGRIRGTGIGGLTLGSGSGWLERKLGFTVDNLLAAEVVLANGERVRASADEHADLFWGLRGGGGNYGVATRFEYRLHPLGPLVWGGLLIFPCDGREGAVLRAYRDFMEGAPDDVAGGAALITVPPLPGVPEGLGGATALAVIPIYFGPIEGAEAAFDPILRLGPAARMVQPMPYVAVQSLLDEANPPGRRNYWKADNYGSLPDEAIDALLQSAARPVSPFTTVLVQPMGGAAARIPDDATAMGWRQARWALHILGMWEDAREDERQIAWVRGVSEALRPWASKGTYLNYLMDEGEGRVRESFGAHYARMVAIKDTYDPGNFFCMNQNIKPSALAGSAAGA